MRAVLVAAIAVVLAAPAAAAPDGFRESRLTPRMKALSGNPAAVVYCARSLEAWDAAVKRNIHPDATWDMVEAFYAPEQNAAYFKPTICLVLERWVRGRTVPRREVGVAAHSFAHEAVHASGQPDERVAECGSLAALATTLRVHFGVKNRDVLRAMLAGARAVNQASQRRC